MQSWIRFEGSAILLEYGRYLVHSWGDDLVEAVLGVTKQIAETARALSGAVMASGVC